MITTRKIILASKSPRRSEILRMAAIPFDILTTEVAEIHPLDTRPENIPLYLAQLKANAVRELVSTNDVVIGADTIVILDGIIYEKPTDRADATRMLRALSGRTHEVVTGVCILYDDQQLNITETTAVTFRPITDEMISYYLDHYQPYDKAGAYACQEWIGAVAIARFDGDYYNVVGLPIHRVYAALQQI